MIIICRRSFSGNLACSKALLQIAGLGRNLIAQILEHFGISRNVKLKHLSLTQIKRLNLRINQRYYIGTDLIARVRKHKMRLSAISCYRASRHFLGLPSRGQRTHGNARTCRKINRLPSKKR